MQGSVQEPIKRQDLSSVSSPPPYKTSTLFSKHKTHNPQKSYIVHTHKPPSMATRAPLLFLVSFSTFLALSHAATTTPGCTSQKFTKNQTYTQCTDLAHLGASLHWTYNSDGSLSIAFVAAPASANGWVSWGINPSTDGMIGTQALIAFKQSNGSLAVNTYNISSYKGISESAIVYPTSDLSAESTIDGDITLFAKLIIGKAIETVNQVYQVGSSVTNGVPDKHAFGEDNLNSKEELALSGSRFSALEPAPAPSNGGIVVPAPGSPATGTGSGSPTSATVSAAMTTKSGVREAWSALLLLLAISMVRF